MTTADLIRTDPQQFWLAQVGARRRERSQRRGISSQRPPPHRSSVPDYLYWAASRGEPLQRGEAGAGRLGDARWPEVSRRGG